MTKLALTVPQTKAFWRLFARAKEKALSPGQNAEEWRHRILKESTGHEHLSQLNRTRDFEAVMARLAQEAEDEELYAKYALSAEPKRIAALAEDCCRQIFELKSAANIRDGSAWPEGFRPAPIDYIGGILNHMRLAPVRKIGPTYYLDVLVTDVKHLFQVLDSHRRTLLKREGMKGKLAYHFGSFWHIDASTGFVACSQHPPPASANFKIIFH